MHGHAAQTSQTSPSGYQMDYYSSQYADQQNYRRESNSSNLSRSSTPSINQRPRQAPDALSNSFRNMSNFSPAPSRNNSPPLTPPHPSFANSRPLSTISSSSSKDASTSLSVNYLPSKFARPASPGIYRRKAKGMTKTGGGREAWGANAARMPGAGDEDYDGVNFGGKGRKLRWNRFKWVLFFANTILTFYSITALIFALLTWFNIWKHADIIRVGNVPELILSTAAAALCLFTCMLGWSGILLNNRAFLAVYTLLLWVCLIFIAAPGYITYRRSAFNLELKVNSQWSRTLGPEGRLRIQNQLHCCGYFSSYVEATISQACYSRSPLPGCKGKYLRFEENVLQKWYTVAFAIVPFHILIILAALLCSNHVTYRFGKGMMPKAYRLNMGTMAVLMDSYANQLAEQYGDDVASDILSRSRSNLNVNSVPYSGSTKDGYKTLGGYDEHKR